MPDDDLDQLSEQIAGHLNEAKGLLAQTEEILDKETTEEHRTQWSNVYRLESATKHAQTVLTRTDPRITREAVATELLEAATLARNTIREAVDTGGGSLIGAAEALLNATARIEPQFIPSEEEIDVVVARLRDVQLEIEKSKSRIDQLISAQNAKFNEAEEKRDTRFDDSLQQAEVNLSQASAEVDKRAGEATEHIAELEEDISKTAAALGGGAIALDNYKESEEQTKRAFWWTVLTVLLLIIAAAIPIAIGIEQSHQSLESVAGKITVALILAGIASYTAWCGTPPSPESGDRSSPGHRAERIRTVHRPVGENRSRRSAKYDRLAVLRPARCR